MADKIREILDADILFVSLCPRGKNGFQTLYKAETAHAHFEGLTKATADFDEKGQLLACVWAPDVADSDGDFATAETVQRMAHSYMKNAAKVDLVHDCEALPKESAYVAESFIIQKGDDRFADMLDYEGNPVDVTGGWGVVMQIDDPELRKAYRDGSWQGVSMYGPAKVRLDAAKATKIKNIIAEKNQRVINALRAWFERDGNLDHAEVEAFRGFERDELMMRVSVHLRDSLDMPEESSMVIASKFVDTVLPETKEIPMTDAERAEMEALKKANEELMAENEALKAAPVEEQTEELTEETSKKADEETTETVEEKTDEMSVEEAIRLAEERDSAGEETEEVEEDADKDADKDGDEVDLADATDEELLAYAAEKEIEALKAETDFDKPESVREFVEKRKEILKKAGLADDKKPVRKARTIKRKPRSNVAAKAETESAAKTNEEDLVKSGKSFAEKMNARRGMN